MMMSWKESFMDMELNAVEMRVLGCLLEKERTTPDYYPLTLNSLMNACNQKSNRTPVMALEKSTILRALDDLRMRYKLAVEVTSSDSRVPKYRHSIRDHWKFTPAEEAILCELFVRGPQTGGDLRAHASRIYPFENLQEVEAALQRLADREEGPMVVMLPREPGRRESRWAHLFSGEVALDDFDSVVSHSSAPSADLEERVGVLEGELAELRSELAELRLTIEQFRSTFE
jgi:uncharacterized protein YceH (UPF0502 family)